jgi:mRNA interferase RelE/StbE
MAASGKPRERRRGNITPLPSGALRVRVYAGQDPVTKKPFYLTATVPPGPRQAQEAEKIGLEQPLSTVDLLADEPRPAGTTEYGSPDLRRLHVGRYRVLYDVNDAIVTVVVIHAGRIG